MDANEFLMSGGAKAASFRTIGTTVTGIICGEPKVQQQTDPKDGSPKFFQSGDPMRVLLVPLQTALRESPDDDGVRTLWVNGKTVTQLREAVRAAGASGLEPGARISQTYIADGEKKGAGLSATKVYSVTYERPAPGAAANAHLMADATPDGTVQQQPAAAPAAAAANGTPPAPPGVDPGLWARMSPEQRAAVMSVSVPVGADAAGY